MCSYVVLVEFHFCIDLLFPFGERIGEKKVRQAIDFVEGPLTIDVPFVFFKEREWIYYVSNTILAGISI